MHNAKKIVNVCLTKWAEGIDDMSISEELLVSIYHSFREMKENKCEPPFYKETSIKADSLFKLVINFSFVIILTSLEIF